MAVLITGLGIGWLAGLSVSPVIATVLASLVGVGAGLVAGLRGAGGADDKEPRNGKSSIDALPAAALVLGIAFGAPLGILARTHQIFEPAGTPARTGEAEQQGVLFNVTAERCDRLRARARDPNEQAFRDLLAGSGEWGRLLEERLADTRVLKTIVEDICASE